VEIEIRVGGLSDESKALILNHFICEGTLRDFKLWKIQNSYRCYLGFGRFFLMREETDAF